MGFNHNFCYCWCFDCTCSWRERNGFAYNESHHNRCINHINSLRWRCFLHKSSLVLFFFCHTADFRLSMFSCVQSISMSWKILLLVLNECAPDFDASFFASSRFNGHNSLLQCIIRLITMLFPCNVYTYFQSDQIKYKNTSMMQFYDYLLFFTLYTHTHRNLNIIKMSRSEKAKKNPLLLFEFSLKRKFEVLR